MRADFVIDASTLGASFFREAHSKEAHAFLDLGAKLAAPSLLTAELTSIASKKVWRGDAEVSIARAALKSIATMVQDVAPCEPLAEEALELATAHRFSAYDAFYLALARRSGVPLVTLDGRLIARAQRAGLGALAVAPSALS